MATSQVQDESRSTGSYARAQQRQGEGPVEEDDADADETLVELPSPLVDPVTPRYRVVVVTDAGERIVELGQGEVSSGRGHLNDISIPQPEIAHRQCRIAYADGRHQVIDCGTTNGVYVDGERIADSRELHDGDEIGIGRVKIRYERVGA
jgi:pSer/pThr/pTyr-binding forkhead associated (FHA) protein